MDNASRVARLVGTARQSVFVAVFAVAATVYLATATYQRPWHIDALTNAVTAWSLAMTGSPLLHQHTEATNAGQFGNVGWIVESPRGPVSQYPPGAALTAVPLYRLWNQPLEPALIRGENRPDLAAVPFPLPSLVPAALTAALTTAGGVALIGSTVAALGADRRASVAAGLVAAFATGHWSVSSNQLWQHGPASALVAGAVFSAVKGNRVAAGVCAGGAILVRPHLALIAATLGIGLAVSERRLRPALEIGIPSAIGMMLLIGFNYGIWGRLTLTGGYGSAFTEGFLENGIGWYALNLWGSLFDPKHGMLTASPFLLFLIPGVRKAWRAASPTVRLAAAGGMVYLLVQLRANRFSGGDGHFGYRYPLEALTATAPLLFLAFRAHLTGVGASLRIRRYFLYAVILSAIPQGLWAILT